uniref:Uncharacterized protein n=1 Tax=Plectus sambesii TaxID=2011161 RepID=A0A914W9X1_9BILA
MTGFTRQATATGRQLCDARRWRPKLYNSVGCTGATKRVKAAGGCIIWLSTEGCDSASAVESFVARVRRSPPPNRSPPSVAGHRLLSPPAESHRGTLKEASSSTTQTVRSSVGNGNQHRLKRGDDAELYSRN